MTSIHLHDEVFPSATAGLPACQPTEIVDLAGGDTYDITITPVANRIGDTEVRMLAYNGSIPGPTLRVQQGTEVTVRVRNDADHETTVHWHGLRLDNDYDGVPHQTQAPIPLAGEFTYRLRFPDDGVYWYHPHVREDYGLEMGLYGNIVVDPAAEDPWPPVDREAVVTLDDVLIEDGRIAPFRVSGPTHTAMGRFGNVMLTGGHTDLTLEARAGEVVRFFFTNTANTRLFNIAFPGTRMKLVGGDSGRVEHEQWVDTVLLAPSERAVVDVLFEEPGAFPLEHRTPTDTYVLGSVDVVGPAGEPTPAATGFDTLRSNTHLEAERARAPHELERAPDKTLVFHASMPILYGDQDTTATAYVCPMHPEVTRTEPGSCPKCGMQLVAAEPAVTAYVCPMHPDVTSTEPAACPRCGMQLVAAEPAATVYVCPMHPDVTSTEPGSCPKCGMGLVAGEAPSAPGHDHPGGHGHDDGEPDGLEWEDLMVDINARTDETNMIWRIVDDATGAANHDIDWTFEVGDRVKLRLVNTMKSDHPMHHPFHVHGAGRFLVLARDDQPNDNLVWKDTVLVRAGETVDLLLELTERGSWMAHCHIAEHHQNGMAFTFRVGAE